VAPLLLIALFLADPVADAKALRDERGVAAFEEIFALAVPAGGSRERQGILDVLASLGPDAVPLVVAKTQLKPPPPRVRECAFMTLQKLAGRDEAAAAVVPLLVHADPAVRRVVRDALKRESAIPALLSALRKAGTGLRNELRAVLKAQGEALRPHLVPLLDDEDADFRKQLVPLLAGAGDLETLAAWTRDADEIVRLQAIAELARHRDAPEVAAPALRAALADDEPLVRAAAVRGLAAFPAKAPDFVEDVALLARDADTGVRAAAVRTLVQLGAPAHPFIRRELRAKDTPRRLLMSLALRDGDADLLPLVESAAKDEAPPVRAAAMAALGRYPQELELLVKALKDEEAVQVAALGALTELGPDAAPAAGAAGRLAASQRLRGHVFEALRAMGPDGLVAFLDVAPDVPPTQMNQALRQWGPKATVPELTRLLGAAAASRRRSAAWALGVFGADAAPAVPELIRALDDEDRFVAGQAIWALGEIGPAAKAAVPALKAKWDDAALRPILRAALKRLE
jgi:HEAT repeat protein